MTSDFHCVTRWSRLDNLWKGVRFTDVLDRAQAKPGAEYVLVLAEEGYTANVPLKDLLRPEVLFAFDHDGQPLEPEHGGPLRLVVPQLYAWKSVKWVRGFTVLDHDQLGFLGAQWVSRVRRSVERAAIFGDVDLPNQGRCERGLVREFLSPKRGLVRQRTVPLCHLMAARQVAQFVMRSKIAVDGIGIERGLFSTGNEMPIGDQHSVSKAMHNPPGSPDDQGHCNRVRRTTVGNFHQPAGSLLVVRDPD